MEKRQNKFMRQFRISRRMLCCVLILVFGIGLISCNTRNNVDSTTVGATPTTSASVNNIPTSAEKPTSTEAPANTEKPTSTEASTSTMVPTVTQKPTVTEESSGDEIAEGTNFNGALHVEGTKLVDSTGTQVQLRGISTHGLSWFPEYVNAEMIKQLKEEWGCNVVRLAMYTAESSGYCTSGETQKKNLKTLIDTGVIAAVENQMYVIIDWHVLNDKNPNTYIEEAKAFFTEMAKKYSSYPNVIYEICNEPNGGTSWTEIRKYALAVIPCIREFAPDAIIIIGTPTWSQDVDVAAANPITEYDNLMYALHFYAATHKDSLRQKCKTAIDKGLPLFVSEYGICDASGNGAIDESQANKWIELLDSYGISHVLWNLSNKAETSSVINSSCRKTNGLSASDLSASGTWFIRMLQGEGYTLEGSSNEGADEKNNNENETVNETTNSTSDIVVVDYTAYANEIFLNTEGVAISVVNGWNSEKGIGLQLDLTVKNTSDKEITDWQRTLTIKEGVSVTVSQCWNATVNSSDNTLRILPMDYNKIIPAGGSVNSIGMIIEIE